MDPAEISTVSELAAAFQRLRGGRSYRALASAAAELPPRDGRRAALPSSTLSDLLAGRSAPTRDTVITFLAACGLTSEEARQPWLRGWARVTSGHQSRPSGAVRVDAAQPRLLGVHAAIRADGTSQREHNDELPPYVPRDLDDELRRAIAVAGDRGGFVLLVGGSSVGKTRALYEAVRAELPDWWLLHPADSDAVREFATAATGRTAVWLDELQRYLNHPGGLPVAAVRDMITHNVVVVATLWPDEYHPRVRPRGPGEEIDDNDRQLLGMAEVVAVPSDFSPGERDRAGLMTGDPRIRVALASKDAGFTQVMAAGPALVSWWEQAAGDQCYGRAVITAALDARRVGVTMPLSRDYLRAAAPGYLTQAQQATAPADWLDRALGYATTPLHGATSTLAPVSAGMGLIGGYEVADYLHQYALRTRRTVPLLDTTWRALADHHHHRDALRLADEAERRGASEVAETIYRGAMEAGDRDATLKMAAFSEQRDRVDEATEILRSRADDVRVAERLVNLLLRQGCVEEVRTRAKDGDAYAAANLAKFLEWRGDVDDAIDVLRPHADPGGRLSGLFDRLLGKKGLVEELDRRATGGDSYAAEAIAEWLTSQGRVTEAVDVLRVHGVAMSSVDDSLVGDMADLLVDEGRVDEAAGLLRSYVDFWFDEDLAAKLMDLLADNGLVDELVERADNDDEHAASRLARLLAEEGRVDELARRAAGGDRHAAAELADLLIEQDQGNAAIDVLRGHDDSASIGRLAELLIDYGRADEAVPVLRTAADAGDYHAANRLFDLLVSQDRADDAIDVLRPFVGVDLGIIRSSIVDLLVAQNRVDEALAMLRADAADGDGAAAQLLVELLVKLARVDEVAGEVAAGTYGAAAALKSLQRGPGRW